MGDIDLAQKWQPMRFATKFLMGWSPMGCSLHYAMTTTIGGEGDLICRVWWGKLIWQYCSFVVITPSTTCFLSYPSKLWSMEAIKLKWTEILTSFIHMNSDSCKILCICLLDINHSILFFFHIISYTELYFWIVICTFWIWRFVHLSHYFLSW